MSDLLFVRNALIALKAKAEGFASRCPPVHHMLVLPVGQTIGPQNPNHALSARRFKFTPQGARLYPGYGYIPQQAQSPSTPPPEPSPTVPFGASRITVPKPAYLPGKKPEDFTPEQIEAALKRSATLVIPPEKYFPENLPPHSAIEIKESANSIFCRRHLFFGTGPALQYVNSLASSILDLRRNLAGVLSQRKYHRSDYAEWCDPLLSSNDLRYWCIDAWLCTIHLRAWSTPNSPIRVSPKIMFAGEAIEGEPTGEAFQQNQSFSYIDKDILTATAATIDVLLGLLDSPIVPVPIFSAVASLPRLQPAIAAVQKVTAGPPQHPSPTTAPNSHDPPTDTNGMRWQTAMKAAESHCARNPFPGNNALAKIVGCAQSTMSKAINESSKLRAMKAEHEAQQKSVLDVAMTEATAESTRQTREDDPADAVAEAELKEKQQKIDADPLLRKLMQDATPEQRKTYLEATPIPRLKELAATAYHDPDAGQRVRGRSR